MKINDSYLKMNFCSVHFERNRWNVLGEMPKNKRRLGYVFLVYIVWVARHSMTSICHSKLSYQWFYGDVSRILPFCASRTRNVAPENRQTVKFIIFFSSFETQSFWGSKQTIHFRCTILLQQAFKMSLIVKTVPTQPCEGQKPGTSGLRKKVMWSILIKEKNEEK